MRTARQIIDGFMTYRSKQPHKRVTTYRDQRRWEEEYLQAALDEAFREGMKKAMEVSEAVSSELLRKKS